MSTLVSNKITQSIQQWIPTFIMLSHGYQEHACVGATLEYRQLNL